MIYIIKFFRIGAKVKPLLITYNTYFLVFINIVNPNK